MAKIDTGGILAYALKLEEDGRRFYLAMVKKAKNPLGKKTLKAIADDEINHIREIKKAAKEFKWGTQRLKESKGVEKRWRTIFSNALKDEKLAKANLTDLNALRLAMRLETKSYNYYKKSAKKVLDLKGKNFFEYLASQENEHYEIFRKTFEYLKDPVLWFKREERHFYEGG